MSWIRKCSLQLGGSGGSLDLSQLQVEFEVNQMDIQEGYPPGASIRVWNPSDQTAHSAAQEYDKVTLQAGYEQGEFGIIFQGTIKIVRWGRLNAKDSFLDIFAADGDFARFGVVNDSLAAGWKTKDVRDKISKAMKPYGVEVDQSGQQTIGGVGPEGIRGKTMYGLGYMQSQDEARRTDSTWTVDKGKMIFTPLDKYREGEIVELNTNTGLVNVPEATIEGVKVICLLNPKIKIGTRVHINQRDINTTTVHEPGYPRFTSLPLYASVTADGIYRVLVVEHRGDTRGHDWYTVLTCLAMDGTSGAVNPYGWKGVPSSASGGALPGSTPVGQGGIGHA